MRKQPAGYRPNVSTPEHKLVTDMSVPELDAFFRAHKTNNPALQRAVRNGEWLRALHNYSDAYDLPA